MATPTVKTTYSLDLQTVDTLGRMAQKWGVSRSEALRRAIRVVAGQDMTGASEALKSLAALQGSIKATRVATWQRQLRAERKAASRRAERAR